MCSQTDEHGCGGCRVVAEENQDDDLLCPLKLTSSEHSAVSVMSEDNPPKLVYQRRKLRGNSAAIFSSEHSAVSVTSEGNPPKLVYQRRKLRGNSAAVFSSEHSAVSAMCEGKPPKLVYQRRKLRGNSVAICSDPAKTKRSDDCLSVVSFDDPSLAAKEQELVCQMEYENGAITDSVVPRTRNLNECALENLDSFTEGHSLDVLKSRKHRRVEVDSVDDSCSSSKFNTDLVSASIRKEVDDDGDCSSSSVMEIIGKDLSEKDLCISILRREGLLERCWPSNNHASAEGIDFSSSSSSSCSVRSCKICGVSETALEMLICDHCEEAFHVTCCNPRMKKLPIDEWYCHLCSRKKCVILKKASTRKSLNDISEIDRRTDASYKARSNPIEFMLMDTEPYTTGVRIGKGFQAEVPDWSGPRYSDVDWREPLPISLSDYISSNDSNSKKPSKPTCIGNWLQCRQAIEGSNGVICGKWRRAPVFEVQTDNWECFCSVQWDPTHADCAVPQELETEEILKQLKYIETLRPKLTGKERESDCTHIGSEGEYGKCNKFRDDKCCFVI